MVKLVSSGVGAPSADQVLSMIGKRVTVTFPLWDAGETVTCEGICTDIEPSEVDGAPLLRISNKEIGRTMLARVDRLTSWIIDA